MKRHTKHCSNQLEMNTLVFFLMKHYRKHYSNQLEILWIGFYFNEALLETLLQPVGNIAD